MKTRHLVIVLAVLLLDWLPCRGQENPPILFHSLHRFTDEHSAFLFWEGHPDWVLQRSFTLESGDWETLHSTLGEDTYEERRREHVVYYRLARLQDEELFMRRLDERLTKLVSNQIERAVNPSANIQIPDLEFPPDDGDATYGLNLFGAPDAYAWVSQPGLIRGYDAQQQGFTKAFKLYSSRDSVIASPEELTAAVEEVQDWKTQPNRYVDLNRAIQEPDGTVRFPIIDPRAAAHGIEGFGYAKDEKIGVNDEALPMPVEWLYILKDGALGTLDDLGQWQGDGEATLENPIIARVAYWADDETSKLNVNVASEGIPWDLPRADTPHERRYASEQPVKGEYQRHPGHPAMTSLSSVFYPGKAAAHPDSNRRLSEEELRSIYQLTPQVAYRDPEKPAVVLEADDHPGYTSIEEWQIEATVQGFSYTECLSGFVTTRNASPEITMLGLPRMSIWPAHEQSSFRSRSAFDERAAAVSSTGRRNDLRFFFQRRDSSSRHGELYVRSNRRNMQLFDYIMNQTYLRTPKYGGRLAAKYGARLKEEDYSIDTDYDKDHYAIALAIFGRLRIANLQDPSIQSPYTTSGLIGENSSGVSPLNLIGRNLGGDNGAAQQSTAWHRSTLEPSSVGRRHTISKLALVATATSEVRITGWTDEGPEFDQALGPDMAAMQRILGNDHPEYANWTGGEFGPEHVGKTFRAIEVALLPEVFAPTQGYPFLRPLNTLRLLTDGTGYKNGVSLDQGIRLNGVPLTLWGRQDPPQGSQVGPGMASVSNESRELARQLPVEWLGRLGGFGGQRLFQFGTWRLSEQEEGWFGPDFLANPPGIFLDWHCQTLVVVEKDQPLTFTQEAPLQFLYYDQGLPGSNTGNLNQVFHFWIAPPGEAITVPAPDLAGEAYRSWSQRIGNALVQGRASPLLDPSGGEVVKGLSLAHSDYRHVALKRSVPGELFTHHPEATVERASHISRWSGSGGSSVENGARQGPEVIGRSLVAGVDYDEAVLPDFVQNPNNRETFAPLLSGDYHFPIDPTITRDFDNGFGDLPDGPFFNWDDGGSEVADGMPYFETDTDNLEHGRLTEEHHFPQRSLISPVSFGSIPSASQANAPWTCLLFRPNVEDPLQYPHLGEAGHGMRAGEPRITREGFHVPQMASIADSLTMPPDHLWLDYFWMPAAEPHQVASQLATQGKVNMNYQIFPFTYIKRATGMHAVLKAEEIMAIPTNAGPTYKTSQDNPNWRHRIDADETLKQFEERFASGELFMTESEICEQFLIPEGREWDGSGDHMRAFFADHRLTGDNTLERPYAGLYSRLTTRSNVFKLHYRIQIIAKAPDGDPGQFDPTKDTISNDRQGAKLLERVLTQENLPDHALNPEARNLASERLEKYYEVIEHQL